MLLKKRKHTFINSKSKKHKTISNNMNSDSEDEGFNIQDLFRQNKDMIYRKDNHIYFRSDINTSSIDKLGNLIDEYNSEYTILYNSYVNIADITPKPIYLHITSDGGCLFSGFMGSDMIRNSKIPIYTVVEGSVASAGTLLSIAGQQRYMTEHSYLLIHQLSSGSVGNYEQLSDSQENNTELMKRLKEVYFKYTHLTPKQINDSLKRDIYWNYDKSKKAGLVDDIYVNN